MADIFAATVTSVNIVYGIVDGWRSYSKDLRDLLMTMKYYLENMQRVQSAFERLASSNGELPEEARTDLEAMNGYLAGLSGRCLKLRTKLESRTWSVYFRKLTWTLQQREVEKLVAVLKDWAQEFDIHWISLPNTVKYRYDLSDKQTVRSLQSPAESIRHKIQSALQGKHDPVPDIKPSDVVDKDPPTGIDPSTAVALRLGQRDFADYDDRIVILEYHTYSEAHRADVELLVQVLHWVVPLTMGILRCEGYFFSQSKGFTLVYNLPSHQEVIPKCYTLRAMLLGGQRTGDIAHALNERFRVAKSLATALFYLHTGGWVHKSIRSSNVIMLTNQGIKANQCYPYALGDAYLAGFEYARADAMSSTPAPGNDGFDEDDALYQHPSRAGVARYSKAFDLYGLGVVLLELGLWKPLHVKKFAKDEDQHATMLKEAKKLRLVMGLRYEKVVEKCLAVGDEDDRMMDSERFVRDVLDDLSELCIAMN